MNPKQKTRKLARELRQFFKVHQYHLNVSQTRGYKSGTGPRDAEIRSYYRELYFYNGLVADRLQLMRQKLQKWADKHAMPQRFDQPWSGEFKLRFMMADEGEGLTNEQVDGYVIVDDPFTGAGGGLNKYQRFFEVLDALADLAAVIEARLQFWMANWEAQGSSPRETEIVTILSEEKNAIVVLSSVISDIAVRAKDDKGDAGVVDELRLRNRYFKRRGPLGTGQGGGMYAINRGVTTTVAVEGGSPLLAGPDPQEYDPSIDTVRDEAEMGTDPGP